MKNSKWIIMPEDELYHYGIKGQKWGFRRFQNPDGSLTSDGKKRYSSTGLRSYIARKKNEKVDAGFKKWKEGSKNRADAIELGKKANLSKLAYEKDKTKENRDIYRKDLKEYKKALGENTTYRKGQVKKEVISDISRKHLNQAKALEKELKKDPNNKELQRKYNKLMSIHDIERAKARRAPEIAENRMKYIAKTKRAMTIAAKTAVASAVTYAGYKVVNKYLDSHDVRLNGQRINLKMSDLEAFKDVIDSISKIFKYV